MHEIYMETGGSESEMIPKEHRSRLVATLITRTQMGALKWEAVDRDRDSDPLERTRRGLMAPLSDPEPLQVLESSSDGLRFRLAIDRSVAGRHKRRGLMLNPMREKQVILTIIDMQNPQETEELAEEDDLPILKDLHQIASNQNQNLKRKIDKFLGNPTR